VRNDVRRLLILVLLSVCTVVGVHAIAQRPRPERSGRKPAMRAIDLCNVEGLWGYATFEVKVPQAQLDKLRPVCQEAYDVRKELLWRDPLPPATIREIGDDMVAKTKVVLGDEADRLRSWFEKREERLQQLARDYPIYGTQEKSNAANQAEKQREHK